MAFDEKEYKRLKQQQADKEEQLILGSSRQFGIYQLRDDAENIRDLAFEGMDWLRKKGLFVDADNYELVYVDSLDGVDLGFKGSVLDDLYERFNLERPEDFVGHSLSVSDVIVLHHDGANEAFFCDRFGFFEVPDFVQRLNEKYQERGEYPGGRTKRMEERTVALTGLPVSSTLQQIIERCESGQYVTLEEISAAPEMKAAASCVSHQTPTVQLKDREDIEDHIFNILSEYGSVSLENGKPLVDSDGNTVYNGIVEQGSRLDIVIGLPASGKSSAIADIISKEHHSMLIDNDEAKRRFPEFNQGWGANAVHAESQIVEQRVFHDAIWQGKNVVLPKVGGDAEGLLDDYIRPAKDAGYQVNVHFVDLDRNKALGRMLNRFIDTGRFLAPELINKYVNERDGNRIEKTFVKLSESVYVDGVSKWSNDVKKGEKPVLKAVRGLTDQFITDLHKTQLSNEQAAEIICRFFQEADAGIAASKEDIYGMLEEQIDAHLYGNSLEEPEIRNDRDYVLTLRSRMNSNLRDMEEVLTDIYKVMRMRDLSHTDLSEDMQKALLDFEVCAVYQKRDLIRTDDFLRAEDRTLQENDKTDKGGQLHGEYGTDEVSGAGAGNTGRLCFGGDSGENGRSGEKGEQGNEGTQRRVRKPVEGGGRQAPEGDPAQVHGRSDVEAFQARLFMELTGHDMDGKAADHAGALRFDFEDIFNTINDDREKYHNAMNGILLSTIYGPVELSTVTKDENGKFGLSEDYYTGKLAEDEERIRRGHTVAFNKYEIVGVCLPDENRLIYENTSLVNPAFDEFVREQESGNSMDGVTFTGYVSGQKQGFEVTFFKDENGEPQFYVTDSGEYSIAKGGGVIPDDFAFDWGNALLLLQNLNMGFFLF